MSSRRQYHFVVVMYQDEMLRLIRQLCTRAMRRMLDISNEVNTSIYGSDYEHPESTHVDVCGVPILHLLTPMQPEQAIASHDLKPYYDHETESEEYRWVFRLPKSEHLQSQQQAALWDYFEKAGAWLV